ncbi:NAD(P)-binding protein [Schizophyllum commune H4-8]|uniref:NAD(P)-binding protein n=1 Tax=Schizophyllum commune (strain H4-8 / FGSC 9210) TaxID=578458 RepID=UPI00215E2334|nr:NAD(P)-binding protein [Schizophyllum commune H4-8]KAI5886355.1 NAD(P)-binding protein [Schizophyllum commune H4-8]
MSHTLTPRVAIVTGAAQGLGKAIALRLAKDGLAIGLNDIPSKKDALDEVAKEIVQANGRAVVHVGDISKQEVVQDLIDSVVRTLGGLHVMVANAGMARPAPFLEESLETFNQVMSVNTTGLFLCYQLAGRKMIELGSKDGRIIGASSIGGKQPLRGLTSYTASKFAVRGLTQSAALALGPYGITVNSYAPGLIDTPLAFTPHLEDHTDLAFDKYSAVAPLRRVGQADEVAALVSFLASKESGYMTGQTLSIDGGAHMD